MTYTSTTTNTFTRTHARHLSSKIAADLEQCSLLYGQPADSSIDDYMDELTELLAGGYVSEYEFGFKRDGAPVTRASWRYVVESDRSITSVVGDAGGLYAKADVSKATYYNFLSYSPAWLDLSDAERKGIKDGLPIKRSAGSLPRAGGGYWAEAVDYGAAGVRVRRQEYRL